MQNLQLNLLNREMSAVFVIKSVNHFLQKVNLHQLP